MSGDNLLWPAGWDAQHHDACNDSLSRCPDTSPAGMRQALADYRRALSVAHHGNEFLDVDLADLMLAALADAWDRHPQLQAQHQHWLTLATAYLIDPDDQSNDFTELSGLDDDAHIVATTLRAIGLADHADKIEEAST